MLVASIPGYNVNKLGKNSYLVHNDDNAAILNKKELKAFAKANDGEVKNTSSTGKKVAAGLILAGSIATAVALHKNNINFNKILKNTKFRTFAENTYAKAVAGTSKIKDTVVDAAKVAGEKASQGTKTFKEKAGKIYNKVAEFVVAIWTKVKNFVTGLFTKKST